MEDAVPSNMVFSPVKPVKDDLCEGMYNLNWISSLIEQMGKIFYPSGF